MISSRVLGRYLIAKSVALLPDFNGALQAFEKGDERPLVAFMRQVIELITPGGGSTPASWFNALGTAKRNKLRAVWREAHQWIDSLPAIALDLGNPSAPGSRFVKFPDPQDQADKVREAYVAGLQKWGKNLRSLEIALQAEDEDRGVSRGGFTIIPMPGVKKAETEAVLEALDTAAEKIRAKFPQVLYGKVFFSTHLSAKTAAHYVYSDDTIHIGVRARKRFDDIYTLIHEFGHRFDHKFLKDDVRKAFWDLSTRKVYEAVLYDGKLRAAVADEAVCVAKARKEGKPFLGLSPELERWAKHQDIKKAMGAFMVGKINEAKLSRGDQGD
jgi:hypothetical protein